MIKRRIAFILCFAMLVSLVIPINPAVSADEDYVKITLDGEVIDSLTIEQDQKIILTASLSDKKDVSYQWQIMVDPAYYVWVNIYDKIEPDCEMSYPVVKGCLDSTNTAYIRCVAVYGDEKFISEAIGVNVVLRDESEYSNIEPLNSVLDHYDSKAALNFSQDFEKFNADGEKEYVTITINYLDIENKDSAIYSPYIATILKDSEFKQNVISPTFLGFAPVYDKDDPENGENISTDATVINFNLNSVSTDLVYNVYYTAIEVPYAIRYFFQNVNDDLYTEDIGLYHQDEALTGTILEEDDITGPAGDTTGFSKMYHIPESVAADGSTVFECYYDRNYYLLRFDLDGGYGVDTIYVRYGTPFVINTPIKHGYNFVGWDLATTDTDDDGKPDKGNYNPADPNTLDPLPTTVPSEDQTYIAIWETVSTTYKVVYWRENADDNDYSYWGYKEFNATSASEVSATNAEHRANNIIQALNEYEYFTYNAEKTVAEEEARTDLIDGKVIVEGDGSTLVHVYYSRNVYTLKFTVNSTFTAPDASHVHTDGNCSCNYKHVHGADCEKAGTICGKTEHTSHTAECITCGKTEHEHKASCYSCGKTEHKHTEDCCTLDEHTHTQSCYTAKQQLTISNTHPNNTNSMTKVGDSEYLYKRNSNYYVYIANGNTDANDYYQVQNANSNTRVELICTQSHTHSTSCFEAYNALDIATNEADDVNNPTNVSGNLYYTRSFYTYYTYYLKIGSNYFQVGDDYYSSQQNFTVILTCGETEHNHDTTTCVMTKCGLTDHEHDGTCAVDCGFAEEHEHVPACYKDTLHAHKDSCFTWTCGKDTHTHSADCCTKPISYKTSSGNTHNYYIIAKYNQTIGEIWPTATHYTNLYGWRVENGESVQQVSKIVTMTSNICNNGNTNKTYTVTNLTSNSANKTVYLYYMFECFDQTNKQVIMETDPNFPASANVRRENDENNKFYEADVVYKQKVNSTNDTFNPKTITGMKNVRVEKVAVSGSTNTFINYLYYDRDIYTLNLYNVNTNLPNPIEEVMYGQPLKDLTYDGQKLNVYEPPYPQKTEQNSKYFEQWYTSPDCYKGTEVDWDGITMPDSNYTIYAKWVPKTHNVKLFYTLDDMNKYLADSTSVTPYETFNDVTHGNVIGSIETPERMGDGGTPLIFAGWFYIDAGKKVAFSPLDIPIKDDMYVFADWSSHSPQPYKIDYVLDSDKTTKVADSSTGFAYAGSTRTFLAKAGDPYNQLYAAYNQGYFPTVASHSITLQYELDKDNPVKNVFTFEYAHAENVEYKIRYVNKETGVVMDEVYATTNKAVVTERFKVYKDMIPDAFYKRLVLEVEKAGDKWVGTENNVITFYYTPNTSSSYYAVHFMLEKLNATDSDRANYAIDGSGGYEEADTHIEGIGDNGKNVEINPLDFPGFELLPNEGKQIVNNKTGDAVYSDGKYQLMVTDEGSELYIFYKRMEFQYTIHYYEYNTTNSLYTSVIGTARYESAITANAPNISGYTCVSANKTQTIPIRPKDEQNVIIFYYAPIQYVVEYVPVTSDGGWLTTTKEVITGIGTLSGSTPTPYEYYEFGGWYTDEACQNPVTATNGTVTTGTNHFLPDKNNLSDVNHNIFYAKFYRKVGDITIKRINAEADQVFVYEVKHNATGEIITVTITGNSTVVLHDMLFGEYTITEKNDWSWRCDETVQLTPHAHESGTTVQFSQAVVNDSYLNGNSEVVVNQRR